MEIREPKFKIGDYVTDRLGFAGRIENILAYRFADRNYIYDVSPLDKKGNWREFDESRLVLYIEKPKSVWDLKEGDTYYVISGYGAVIETTPWKYNIDSNSRKIGNAFLTKEEAEFEVERRKIEAEMLRLGGKRKAEQGKVNWFLEYRPVSGRIETLWSSYEMRQGAIYFDSEEKAKEAVETIGADKIKKYIFGVEE